MFRKILIAFLCFLSLYGIARAAEEFDVLAERIGPLRIEMPEAEVKKAIANCTLKRGRETEWGADGAYHQTWKYADCGLELGMVSDKKGGAKSIFSIMVKAPSTFASRLGIRIGSSRQEVVKAYKAFWNKEESPSKDGFVAGSIYGGLMFTFEKGKVSQMFLGAAAE